METETSYAVEHGAEEIHRTGIERELACQLTRDELTDVAIHKAELEDALEQLEAELAEVKASFKRRTDELDALIAADRQVLKSQSKQATVRCYERWRGNMLELVRTDTGEVVDSRAPTLRDTQQTIPGSDDEQTEQPSEDAELAGDAARTQADAGVAEDDEPPESNGVSKRKAKKRKGKR